MMLRYAVYEEAKQQSKWVVEPHNMKLNSESKK